MKRHIMYGLILIALLFVPVDTMKIGQVHPVQVVSVCRQGEKVVIETDTEDRGVGITTEQALTNLQETTGGIIYLDTAEYLLLDENAEDVVEDLRSVLKGGTRLCKIKKAIHPKETVNYLRANEKLPKLRQWKTGDKLPVLDTFEDRLIFLKKVENSA